MNYKFSVVMPLYNAEAHLHESVDSILQQTIGFEDNIQIILINDGSRDNTETIALELAQRYPNNIIYIAQENGGVSKARNTGFKYIKGEYTVFFDWDDLWEDDAFEKASSFFTRYDGEFDLCSCRMEFIGDYARQDHPLDYKYSKGDRVVDLDTEPNMVQSTIGNAIFRTDAIRNLRFDESVITGEDNLFNNTLLLEKRKIGILSSTKFYYRRNLTAGSLSRSSTRRKEWYLDVPRGFYLGLCNISKSKYGAVLPFIQYAIRYDLRWRHYNEEMHFVLTEKEVSEYRDIMCELLSQIDDDVIALTDGINQYYKLDLFRFKYGDDVIRNSRLVDKRLCYHNTQLLSFSGPSFYNILLIEIADGVMTLGGIFRKHTLGKDIKLYAKTGDLSIEATIGSLETHNYTGILGDVLAEGYSFEFEIPVSAESEISFYAKYGEDEFMLNPAYKKVGISRDVKGSYVIKDNFIIKRIGAKLRIYDNTKLNRLRCYLSLRRNGLKTADQKWLDDWKRDSEITKINRKKKLKNQVAFISIRTDNEISSNFKAVYNAVKSNKKVYCKMGMFTEEESAYKAANIIAESKVLVVDDYLYYLRKYGKKKGQTVIQLWHAAGAFKKFGQDGTKLFLPIDRSYHRDYDAVIVSAEEVRGAYASAFNVDLDKIKALGVARTDAFFNEDYIEMEKQKVYNHYPQLKDKEIILYAPTFRDIKEFGRAFFRPRLNFDRLSEQLSENQVFVICPHPVMTEDILPKEYDNILEIRDLNTSTVMMSADLLVTDYSSVIFECSLLNTPMLFFCYDYDEYARDFYLDYEKDLPGRIVYNEGELFKALAEYKEYPENSLTEFKSKYMAACDGNATERVAAFIDECVLQ